MEMAESFDYTIIWNIFSSVTFHLITLGICVYYIIKKQSIDGYLLASGAFIHILTSVFYSAVLPVLARTGDFSIYQNSLLIMVVSVIGFLGSVLYIIGFIMLIVNYVSLSQKYDEKIVN
jgi:hypothetical protein